MTKKVDNTRKLARTYGVGRHNPGLVDVESDAAQVDRAEEDLRRLLANPYYIEALIRLKDAGHPMFTKVQGRPPNILANALKQKGDLAALLLTSVDRTPADCKLKSPTKKSENSYLRVARQIVAAEKKHGNLKPSRIGACRRLVWDLCPTCSHEQVETVARTLADMASNLLKEERRRERR